MSVAEFRSNGWSISHCHGTTPVGGCHQVPSPLGAGAWVVVVTGAVVDVGDVVVVVAGVGWVVVVGAGDVVVVATSVVVVVVTIGEKINTVVVVVGSGDPRTGSVVGDDRRGRVVVVDGAEVGPWRRQFGMATRRSPACGLSIAPEGFDVARMRGTQINMAAIAMQAFRRVRHWRASVASEMNELEPEVRSMRMETDRPLA
jgi:hypothetical protein